MTDGPLLDDLIAKLRVMEEQLSMAELEAARQSLLASRIRHLLILARYVHAGLDKAKESAGRPAAEDGSERRPA